MDVIYLEFKKNVDSVLHQSHSETYVELELQGYGITGRLLNWIQEFLCHIGDRELAVVLTGVKLRVVFLKGPY